MPHIVARHSHSKFWYFFSLPVSALDANITSVEFCRSTFPSPHLDASVCKIVETLGL